MCALFRAHRCRLLPSFRSPSPKSGRHQRSAVAWTADPRVPAKLFYPRCCGECVGRHKFLTIRAPFIWLLTSTKYRLLAAANFQLVAVGILEKKGVVTRTVAFANFRALELFPARFAHELCNPIHFLPRIGPKRDSCAIRFVVFVWTKAKEFRRSVATGGIKSMKGSAGFFVNESKLRQEFSVKPFCRFHVCHTQIDVIEATCFHLSIFDRVARHFKRV
jgi:hypothetical protein